MIGNLSLHNFSPVFDTAVARFAICHVSIFIKVYLEKVLTSGGIVSYTAIYDMLHKLMTISGVRI